MIIFAKKWRFGLETKLNYAKNLTITLVFEKKRQFCRPKIVENRRKL
jgi:hypothetical protein